MSSSPESDFFVGNLDFQIRRKLSDILDEDDCWLRLFQRVSTQWCRYTSAQQLRRTPPSPAEALLTMLHLHGMTMLTLVEHLKQLRLENALLLLCDYEPVTIVAEPEEMLLAYEGPPNSILLECKAEGLPFPQYQWYKHCKCNSVTELLGEQKSLLHISPVTLNDKGIYYCTITNENENGVKSCKKSRCTTVVVVPLNLPSPDVESVPIKPFIQQQPKSPSSSGYITVNSTLVLNCGAISRFPLMYKWFKNTEEIEGATQSRLEIAHLMPENEISQWKFQCMVYNDHGQVLSDVVSIQVEVPVDNDAQYFAEDKVALLIGNSKYQYIEWGKLKAPSHDVVTLAEQLTSLNFKVVALLDLNLVEMKNALALFSELLSSGVYGVFYYAGHGVEVKRCSYMMPVDTPQNFSADDTINSIDIESQMQTNNPALCFIMLDMCRTLPPPNFQEAQEETIPETIHPNVLIAYATSSYCSAYEEKHNENGIFMKYLQEYIAQDLNVRDIINKVISAIGNDKLAASLQFPSYGGNLRYNYKLRDPIRCTDSEAARRCKVLFDSINDPPKSYVPSIPMYCATQNVAIVINFKKYLTYLQNGLVAEVTVHCGVGSANSYYAYLLNDNANGNQERRTGDQPNSITTQRVFLGLQKLKEPMPYELYMADMDRTVLLERGRLGFPLIAKAKLWEEKRTNDGKAEQEQRERSNSNSGSL